MHNFDAQLFQAQGFLEAYRRCDPELEIDDGSLIATPALVCAAFSIEVGLKLLLSRSGRTTRGHDLFKLYRKLPRHLQYQIRHGTAYTRRAFIKELLITRNSFEEWRYVYETVDGLMVSIAFLGRLAETVVYICEKNRSCSLAHAPCLAKFFMGDRPDLQLGEFILVGTTKCVVSRIRQAGHPLGDCEIVCNREKPANRDVAWRGGAWAFVNPDDLGGYAERDKDLAGYIRILRRQG